MLSSTVWMEATRLFLLQNPIHHGELTFHCVPRVHVIFIQYYIDVYETKGLVQNLILQSDFSILIEILKHVIQEMHFNLYSNILFVKSCI